MKTKKTKKRKYGKLGQCRFILKAGKRKGKRCLRKATYIEGNRNLCKYHYMTESEMDKPGYSGKW